MRKLNRTFLLFVLGALCLNVRAQTKFTLSGSIKDKKNGEQLTGANVIVRELPATGTAANEYGFYSLTLPQGKYTIIYKYISYNTDTVSVVLDKNVKMDMLLSDASTQLQ